MLRHGRLITHTSKCPARTNVNSQRVGRGGLKPNTKCSAQLYHSCILPGYLLLADPHRSFLSAARPPMKLFSHKDAPLKVPLSRPSLKSSQRRRLGSDHKGTNLNGTMPASSVREKPDSALGSKKKLFEDESDLASSDDDQEDGGAALEGPSLKINKEYARRFEHNKKREELQRLEEKYGSSKKAKSVAPIRKTRMSLQSRPRMRRKMRMPTS